MSGFREKLSWILDARIPPVRSSASHIYVHCAPYWLNYSKYACKVYSSILKVMTEQFSICSLYSMDLQSSHFYATKATENWHVTMSFSFSLTHYLVLTSSEFRSLCMKGIAEFLSLSVLDFVTWNFSLNIVCTS